VDTLIKMPTTTTNRIHFTDLDPLRFEDLSLNLVSRLHEWKEISHFGRSGNDQGVDIHCTLDTDSGEKHWVVQCKRYLKFTKKDARKVIEAIQASTIKPDKLLLIIACDVTQETDAYFKTECQTLSISAADIWTASILEAKLYKEHKDLLFIYFGIKMESRMHSNASRIRYAIKMKKRLEKELIDPKAYNDPETKLALVHYPYSKFISSRVIIRSIDDTTYPEAKGELSNWNREHFYDLRHNGLEVWLAAALGHYIIMAHDGKWELLKNDNDIRQNNPKYKTARIMIIGRIPFDNIVECLSNGDEYYNDPQLFCHFKYKNGPYEEISYKIYPDQDVELPSWELDPEKRTEFP